MAGSHLVRHPPLITRLKDVSLYYMPTRTSGADSLGKVLTRVAAGGAGRCKAGMAHLILE
jgi:hypothetical protein